MLSIKCLSDLYFHKDRTLNILEGVEKFSVGDIYGFKISYEKPELVIQCSNPGIYLCNLRLKIKVRSSRGSIEDVDILNDQQVSGILREFISSIGEETCLNITPKRLRRYKRNKEIALKVHTGFITDFKPNKNEDEICIQNLVRIDKDIEFRLESNMNSSILIESEIKLALVDSSK